MKKSGGKPKTKRSMKAAPKATHRMNHAMSKTSKGPTPKGCVYG